MKKKVKVISIQNCGGKKKGGCGSNWAGATSGQTTIRIAA